MNLMGVSLESKMAAAHLTFRLKIAKESKRFVCTWKKYNETETKLL